MHVGLILSYGLRPKWHGHQIPFIPIECRLNSRDRCNHCTLYEERVKGARLKLIHRTEGEAWEKTLLDNERVKKIAVKPSRARKTARNREQEMSFKPDREMTGGHGQILST